MAASSKYPFVTPPDFVKAITEAGIIDKNLDSE